MMQEGIRGSGLQGLLHFACMCRFDNAVHAAMAGKTKLIIGLVNNTFVHIPIRTATMGCKKVDPEGSLWRDAIEATQAPAMMVNPR